MSRVAIVLSGIVLLAAFCYGQGANPDPAQGAPAAIGHGSFPVKIDKTLDSSKLKAGDAVEVETSGGFKLPDGTLVPKGSKLVGHVTAAMARSKGDAESELAVSFDKLNIANGKQFSVKGAIQAVFPPADEPDPGVPSASTSPHSGSAGGLPPPDYRPMTEVKSGSNTADSSGVQAAADPKSAGVHGFDNLQLQDGVLSSKGKNVKLGGGVRLIVRADILG
jgi:hypothetical protein